MLDASRREAERVTSSYLDQPLLPMAVALPRILAQIELELATALPGRGAYRRRRAELLRGLLAADHSTDPNCEQGGLAGSSWSGGRVWSVVSALDFGRRGPRRSTRATPQ